MIDADTVSKCRKAVLKEQDKYLEDIGRAMEAMDM